MEIFKKHIILALAFFCCAFSTKADTVDNYQIHIRKKLVLNESGYGSFIKKVNLLVLKKQNLKDSLSITFNHCTWGSTERRIKLLDSAKNIILEWNFPDEVDESLMQISIKKIWEQSSMPFLTLYYYDSQIPKGRFLTLIAFEDKNLARVISTYKNKFKNY